MPIDTKKELAAIAGVSHDTLARVAFIEANADATLKAKLRAGDATIHAVYTGLKREQNRAEKIQALIQESQPPDGSLGRFPVIYADPPWEYDENTTDPSRVIENHYPTMELEAICALPVPSITTDMCILFLWATNPLLFHARGVIEAWGFEYQTNFVWVKPSIGGGYWGRQQHELLLIATKGEFPKPPEADRPPSVMDARRGAHSEKPAVAYEWIERMYPDLPKIELFGRNKRKGWAVWGNMVPTD